MSLDFFLALFLSFFTSTNAFDIIEILGRRGEFSTFNTQLIQSGLANEINVRPSITVLAIDNIGMSRALGKPEGIVKELLSMHVILDYLDIPKLSHLTSKTLMMTTLFQASGKVKDQEGFLNMTISPQGQVTFSSAAGNSNTANLVKPILSEPYNISVLHIDTMIVIPHIEPPGDFKPSPTRRPHVPSPRSSSTPRISPSARKFGPSPRGYNPTMSPSRPLDPYPPRPSPRMSPVGPLGPSAGAKSPGMSPSLLPLPKGWSPEMPRSPGPSPAESWSPYTMPPPSSDEMSPINPSPPEASHKEKTMPPAAATTPAFSEPAYPHLPPNPFPSSGEPSKATPPGVACMITNLIFLSFVISLLPSFE